MKVVIKKKLIIFCCVIRSISVSTLLEELLCLESELYLFFLLKGIYCKNPCDSTNISYFELIDLINLQKHRIIEKNAAYVNESTHLTFCTSRFKARIIRRRD